MEPTVLDAVLLFLILAGGTWGVMEGAIKVAAPFAAILAGVSLVHAYPEVSARFGTGWSMELFVSLLLGLIGLVTYGFMIRILHGAVRASGLGPVNRLLGLGLGLVAGTILAGALVWGLETYGGMQGPILLRGSLLSPAVNEFFLAVMAFTQRMFPRSEQEALPWWRRPWW